MTEDDRQRLQDQMAELRALHWDDERKREIIERSMAAMAAADQMLEDAPQRAAANARARLVEQPVSSAEPAASAHPRAAQPAADGISRKDVEAIVTAVARAEIAKHDAVLEDGIGYAIAMERNEVQADLDKLRQEIATLKVEVGAHAGVQASLERLNRALDRLQRSDDNLDRLDRLAPLGKVH